MKVNNMWKQRALYVVPFIVSATGIIPIPLSSSLQKLEAHLDTDVQL